MIEENCYLLGEFRSFRYGRHCPDERLVGPDLIPLSLLLRSFGAEKGDS